ncbi:solute carrier organic anion transporter family member 74D-like [Centruroides vittatus]|uniref:solute carrier organic anion transporter family member 74D-like n=1 Tax=Centruroides vittatus TaxID=120091 RepID=UPI00350FE32F
MDEDKSNLQCGFGKWRPKWLQRFAKPSAFLISFSLLGIVQGAYYAYLIGVISTIEKRYSFNSKATGLILTMDNVTPILTSTIIGYYGRNINRPKWIGLGMLIVVISCFLSCLPYFIYGPAFDLFSNTTNLEKENELCETRSKEKDCDDDKSITIPALTCFALASLLKGFGSTAYYTIGIPYMDDNIKKKQSALYLGICYALRLLGPTFGFVLSSVCLRYYEYPGYTPSFSKEDPRWIGAWWLGFLILGIAMIIGTIPMFFFPAALTKAQTKRTEEKENSENETNVLNIKDILISSLRILRNPVIFWYMMSDIIVGNGWLGHYIFLPKYFESQFGQAAADANLLTGPVALISMQVGLISGGIIIRKFKPKPHYIAFSVMINDIISAFLIFSFMMMGCPQILMLGTENRNGELILENSCNSNCECTLATFQPVCGTDSLSTYFSPCFAGCTESNDTLYSNCQCVHDEKQNFTLSTAVSEYCKQNCQKLIPYIVTFSLLCVISSVNSVGFSLLLFRAIDPKDKSLALGLGEAILSIFVFIPNPLIYGAITDTACMVWEEKCGKKGNCWIYDSNKFRYYLHGSTGGLLLIGAICDFFIAYHSRKIKNFYDDEADETGEQSRKSSTARETYSNVSLKKKF